MFVPSSCRPRNPVARAGRPLVRAGALLAAAAVTAGLVSGCGGPSAGASHPSTASTYQGDQLGTPVVLSRPARTDSFTSSDGGPTTLAHLQQGRLMLLYFGYTNCPDVCPTTMADLGLALHRLPVQVQTHTQVVFVTSDPARDTPAVMKTWLANFDAGLPRPFVGLTASIAQIDAVAKSVGVPLSAPVTQPNGTITVQHGAQTLAFVGGRAEVLWLAGTSVADYAHDIARLATKVAGT